MTKRFLTPGDPFVLVLTNVCTVGVDLHDYCWDVVHYTPSWTPHDLEQKTGRIDRPRKLNILKKRLALGRDDHARQIRVHHLVWPYTYDERVLCRVHLRAQFSERLLSAESQKTVEEGLQNEELVPVSRFRALNLAP